MFKSSLLLLLALASPAILRAAPFDYPVAISSGASIGDFIPAGWAAIDTARGDLNNDRRADYAVVLEYPRHETLVRTIGSETIEIEGRPRILLVLFGSADGTLTRSCQSNTLILSETEGGMMGDPLDGIEIERGTLVVAFWGGSSEKWNLTYRFRYQNKGWFMIGATSGGGNAEASYSYDYNLVTGRIDISKSNGDRDRVTRRMVKKRALPRLESYVPWSMTISDEMTF
jgi:hypothetical protein